MSDRSTRMIVAAIMLNAGFVGWCIGETWHRDRVSLAATAVMLVSSVPFAAAAMSAWLHSLIPPERRPSRTADGGREESHAGPSAH